MDLDCTKLINPEHMATTLKMADDTMTRKNKADGKQNHSASRQRHAVSVTAKPAIAATRIIPKTVWIAPLLAVAVGGISATFVRKVSIDYARTDALRATENTDASIVPASCNPSPTSKSSSKPTVGVLLASEMAEKEVYDTVRQTEGAIKTNDEGRATTTPTVTNIHQFEPTFMITTSTPMTANMASVSSHFAAVAFGIALGATFLKKFSADGSCTQRANGSRTYTALAKESNKSAPAPAMATQRYRITLKDGLRTCEMLNTQRQMNRLLGNLQTSQSPDAPDTEYQYPEVTLLWAEVPSGRMGLVNDIRQLDNVVDVEHEDSYYARMVQDTMEARSRSVYDDVCDTFAMASWMRLFPRS